MVKTACQKPGQKFQKSSPGKKIFKGEKGVFLDQKKTEEVIGKSEVELGVNCKWLVRRKQKSDGH